MRNTRTDTVRAHSGMTRADRSMVLRTACWLGTAMAGVCLLASCSSLGEDPSSDLSTVQQTIYYGTRSPSRTNLSDGEQAAIGFLADQSGDMFCTATLIDRDVAVTARHCVEGTIAVDLMRFGIGHPNDPDALIPIHSAPFSTTLDVALLFLQEDAVDRVPSIEPLPFNRVTPDEALVGTEVEAAGYGQTHDGSEGLYFVALELTGIEREHLVVNGWGERGICFGDSGGPLFIHAEGGEPVIAAVESYGDSSCVDQDFETRLDQAASWIDLQMESFDPMSVPQEGPQGEEWDTWCIPVGDDSAGLLNPGTPLTVGQGIKACPEGYIALCTASPDQRLPGALFAILAMGIILLTVRRHRREAVTR